MKTSRTVASERVSANRRVRRAVGLRVFLLIGLVSFGWCGCNRRAPEPPATASKTPPKPIPRDPVDAPVETPVPPPSAPLAVAPTVAPARAKVAAPEPPAIVDRQAPDSKLPLYELKMAIGDARALDRESFSDNPRPATFLAGGVVYEGVKVRVRGAWSRGWPKKSLKIFFDHNQPFAGHNSLDLNSGWRDPAFVRETLAYHVYARCGAPASTSRLVRLEVNGQFRGLYIEVEVPGKSLLRRHELKGASLYKAISRSNTADERDLGGTTAYPAHYKKETQTDEGYDELARFCRELNRTSKPLDFFTRYVDLDKYINYLAASVLVQNWDSYNKNHYLVYDGRGSKKWFAVPWDLDRTLGDHWSWSFSEARLPLLLGTRREPGITGWNRMQERFFNDATLRARFAKRLAELLETEFTPEKLFPFLDRLESEIAPEAKLDRRLWPNQSSDFHRGIAQVKTYIERRRAFLLAELTNPGSSE